MDHSRWYGDNLWRFVPVLGKLKSFFATTDQYPFQEGSSLTAGEMNGNCLKAMKAMNLPNDLEERVPTNQ